MNHALFHEIENSFKFPNFWKKRHAKIYDRLNGGHALCTQKKKAKFTACFLFARIVVRNVR